MSVKNTFFKLLGAAAAVAAMAGASNAQVTIQSGTGGLSGAGTADGNTTVTDNGIATTGNFTTVTGFERTVVRNAFVNATGFTGTTVNFTQRIAPDVNEAFGASPPPGIRAVSAESTLTIASTPFTSDFFSLRPGAPISDANDTSLIRNGGGFFVFETVVILAADETPFNLSGQLKSDNNILGVFLGGTRVGNNLTGATLLSLTDLGSNSEFAFAAFSGGPGNNPLRLTFVVENDFDTLDNPVSLSFSATTAVVPEPGVIAFAAVNGIGMAGMVLRARRRSKRSTAVAA